MGSRLFNSLRERRPDLWLGTYALESVSRIRAHVRRRRGLTHLLFLVCDHFEPLHGAKNPEQVDTRLRTWRDGYASLQNDCRAHYGHAPLHTWFYPPHHGNENLVRIADMVYAGLGEAELHFHHDNDTAESLRASLRETIRDYAQYGLLLESGDSPKTSFGFVHGDWALDNSCHGRFCGVNGELSILREFGCWGDFTMPSANQCQTRKINSIYYAHDDPARSKSHDWGRDARVGESSGGGFFLMQGPLGINWRGPRYPRVENASLTSLNWGTHERIRKWIDCNVHVRGRADWLFLKLHAHGAVERDFDALFGEKGRGMHRLLNEQFNDGRRFKLHYVTAREAFNIAQAAQDGRDGDPGQWRDYRVPRPALSLYFLSCAHQLRCASSGRLDLVCHEPAPKTVLRTRVGPAREIRGALREIAIDTNLGTIDLKAGAGVSQLEILLEAGVRVTDENGRDLSGDPGAGEQRIMVALAKGSARLKFGHRS